MSLNTLEDLMRRADEAAGPPQGVPLDSAKLVAEFDRRRTRRNHRAYSIVAALFLAGGAWLIGTAPPREPPAGFAPRNAPSIAIPAASNEEADRLAREAESRMAIVRHLLAEQQRQDRLAELRRQPTLDFDPARQARQYMDQAAFTMVQNADRMCRDLSLCAEALERYRRAAHLFPETAAAAVARSRISEMETPRGA